MPPIVKKQTPVGYIQCLDVYQGKVPMLQLNNKSCLKKGKIYGIKTGQVQTIAFVVIRQVFFAQVITMISIHFNLKEIA